MIEHTSNLLTSVEVIIITFEVQKMTKKIVHSMFATNGDILNPVLACSSTTSQYILNTVPKALGDTTVCSFWTGENTINFDLLIMAQSKLRAVVKLIGRNELSFDENQVGLHSLHAGRVMAMFLLGFCDIIINEVDDRKVLRFWSI